MNDFFEDKGEDKESEYFKELSNIINTQDTIPNRKNKKFRYVFIQIQIHQTNIT